MAKVRADTVPRQRQGRGAGEAEGSASERSARSRPTRDPGGRTVIPESVVEKVADRAIREVSGAWAARSRAARAQVSGDVVLLRLRIAMRYPGSAREAAERVRTHVKHRVEWVTGKRVHHVDIEIAELVR